MRIISGSLKGRRLNPPAKSWPTRPTTDFSREGLFNILQNRVEFEALIALDLFGGTGSHSFELISRGCENVTYVDMYRPCVEFVKLTSKTWNVDQYLKIIQDDVLKFIAKSRETYNYIFAGPPYPLKELGQLPALIFQNQLLQPGGLFILEHNPNYNFSKHPHFVEMRKYGSTQFSFFKMPETIESSVEIAEPGEADV